jgi:hypothetical protein
MHLGNHESFDFSSVGNMGPNAQVNHRSTAVNSGRRSVGYFALNQVFFVFVILSSAVNVSSFVMM